LRTSIAGYSDLGDLIAQTADIFRPPDRITISKWAAQPQGKGRYLNNRGAYVGPWTNEAAPYLVEPMDSLQSRNHDAVVFVGPAQCGKTEIILNWAGHSIDVDPGDMTIYSPTQANARDFSVRRVDRMLQFTEQLGKALLDDRDANNKYDKHFKSGMILGLAWPTVAELAGKPIGRIALTDRDRMDDDIDGEGDPFDLATKRTTSYGSFAMTLCESSPSRPIIDVRQIPKTPHEAPPCKGILALYNRGHRARWYVPCKHCGEHFEMRFEKLWWDKRPTSILERAESVRMICPTCEYKLHPDDRWMMQQGGLWVPDMCGIVNGEIVGEPRQSRILSYWLEGCSAMFTNWTKLVAGFLTAEEEYDNTLDEGALTKFYNNDLGRPYRPKSAESTRSPEDLMARSEEFGRNEDGEIEVISEDGALLALVDVQKNMWIVQVFQIIKGEPFDLRVVERFDIRKSLRLDEDDDALWVKPGVYLEDWDLLIDQVIRRTYPVQGMPGHRIGIKAVGCDSGGKAGVTAMAYDFWRSLKPSGLHLRFHLLKGTGLPTAPQVRESWPDASGRSRKSAARGDVPVWMLNSNMLKDVLNNRLEAEITGAGMIHFPNWLPRWFFDEMTSEIWTEKGWQKLQGRRNEAWDLTYYCLGLAITRHVKANKINWENPPDWCVMDPDRNPLLIRSDSDEVATEARPKYDLTELARKIAGGKKHG
jgi:phage terminase large subunit GpA-like protein